MLISKDTMNVLKAFSTINPSIYVKPEGRLRTMAVAKNIISIAKISEQFPTDFAIYDLNQFLSAASLFDKPDFEFSEKWVNIREEGKKRGGIKYFYCRKELIVYPTQEISVPDDSVTLEFAMTQSMIDKMNKAGAVLGVPDAVIVADDAGISFIVKDRKNDSSNDYEIPISDDAVKTPVTANFKLENLKLIPGDYRVQITNKGIGVFTSKDGGILTGVAMTE